MRQAIDTSQAWLSLINKAQKSIDLQGFYLTDEAGTVSVPVFKALKEAAQSRGVKLRILLDSKFFKNSADTVKKLQNIANIEIRTITFKGVMHAKFFIVDGEQAFLGSQNFDWRAMAENHELGVILPQMLSNRLVQVFNNDWQVALPLGQDGWAVKALPIDAVPPENALHFNTQKDLSGDGILAVSPPISGFHREIDVLKTLLTNAQKTIDIQVMNYSTRPKHWYEIKDALVAASSRGVKIRMSVANWQFKAKGGLSDMLALADLPNTELRYSNIPQLATGCIPYSRVNHAKFMVVDDDIVWIGTGNWTKDYFYNTRNVTFIKRDTTLAAHTRGVFDTMWKSSYMLPISRAMPLPELPDVTCSRQK